MRRGHHGPERETKNTVARRPPKISPPPARRRLRSSRGATPRRCFRRSSQNKLKPYVQKLFKPFNCLALFQLFGNLRLFLKRSRSYKWAHRTLLLVSLFWSAFQLYFVILNLEYSLHGDFTGEG